jgi:putative Mn2+ efflux pump MntP
MIDFFKEDTKLSMTRLLSLVTVLTGLAIGVIAAIKGNANTSITAISLGFVSAGLGTKVIQKMKENK